MKFAVALFCRVPVRFDWRGMNSGQHLIEVNYTGDGLNLEASRLGRVTLTGVTDSDGDG